MYGILAGLMYGILQYLGCHSYVLDTFLMYWILFLCMGCYSYVLDTTLMYGLLLLVYMGYYSWMVYSSYIWNPYQHLSLSQCGNVPQIPKSVDSVRIADSVDNANIADSVERVNAGLEVNLHDRLVWPWRSGRIMERAPSCTKTKKKRGQCQDYGQRQQCQ